MKTLENFVGNTPLVDLRRLGKGDGNRYLVSVCAQYSTSL